MVTFLSVLTGLLGVVMAVVSIFMPQEEPARRKAKLLVAAVAFLLVVAVVWQGIVNGRAQEASKVAQQGADETVKKLLAAARGNAVKSESLQKQLAAVQNEQVTIRNSTDILRGGPVPVTVVGQAGDALRPPRKLVGGPKPGTVVQRSEGSGSPNIVGDNNTVNIGIQPRRLSRIAQSTLVQFLKTGPTGDAEILTSIGGAEAGLQADIESCLVNSGWTIKNRATVPTSPQASGLWLMTRSESTPTFRSLLMSLRAVGLDVSFNVDTKLSADTVTLLFARSPQ